MPSKPNVDELEITQILTVRHETQPPEGVGVDLITDETNSAVSQQSMGSSNVTRSERMRASIVVCTTSTTGSIHTQCIGNGRVWRPRQDNG